MIRVLNACYPTRTLILLLCEVALIASAFLVATILLVGPDAYIALVYQGGMLKILCICTFTILLTYYFDLYEPQRLSKRWEAHFRLLLVLSTLSFVLAAVLYAFPRTDIAPDVLLTGTAFLTVVLLAWRSAYDRIIGLSIFREHVFVLGNGELAQDVVNVLRSRKDIGMQVVDVDPEVDSITQDVNFGAQLRSVGTAQMGLNRIIVALQDRRRTMPVKELLALRLQGVIIEEYNSVIERLTGRIPLEGLNPSALIFTQGFNVKVSLQIARRIFSIFVSALALVLCLPFLPFIVLAVHLSSPGPILFRQVRVGRGGRHFTIYKFRTMRQDAESNGAQWATRNDSRITWVGRFMRKTRLDEIPQLWNVLRGDMNFVGPRPERPEFVQWLVKEIPYYEIRHIIRPGLTGWAQVRYQYGASLEETKRKLEYDLFYIKHLSLGLDLLIMFETIKTIVLRRGAQ